MGQAIAMSALFCAIGTTIATANGDVPVGQIDLLGWLGSGTSGQLFSTARAINNAGQVVGESTAFPGFNRAYRYTNGVGLIDLGNLPGDPSAVFATGVNTSGDVVGYAPVGGGIGFRYQDSVGMSQVGAFGDSTSIRTISDSGLIAGRKFIQGVGNTAFTQSPGGGFMPFGNNTTTPLRSSSSGVITGFSSFSGAQRAFVYSPGGSLTALPLLPGSASATGRGINDIGQVVGEMFDNALNNNGAFVWSSSSGVKALPSPIGAFSTFANAINDSGWIVGQTDGAATRGILWLPGQQPIDLTDYVHVKLGRPDITILSAEDINDFGQIVGQAEIGSVRQGYRLTIPSPSSGFVIASLGTVALLRRRRRDAHR